MTNYIEKALYMKTKETDDNWKPKFQEVLKVVSSTKGLKPAADLLGCKKHQLNKFMKELSGIDHVYGELWSHAVARHSKGSAVKAITDPVLLHALAKELAEVKSLRRVALLNEVDEVAAAKGLEMYLDSPKLVAAAEKLFDTYELDVEVSQSFIKTKDGAYFRRVD